MGEEMAATPGWVSGELDGLLGGLPAEQPFEAARGTYADCLAAVVGDEPQVKRARCRRRFLEHLEELGVDGARRAEIDHRLEALEAEIDQGT